MNFKVFTIALLISIPFTIAGALFKLLHWPGATVAMILSLLPTLVYMILGIALSVRNTRDTLEKLMWIIGFLAIPMVTGLVFYFTFRRKLERTNRSMV